MESEIIEMRVNRKGAFNELDEDSPRCKQPKGLKIKLKPHQLSSIEAMLTMEENSSVIIENPDITSPIYPVARKRVTSIEEFMESSFKFKTNIAILSDKVGAGKSYMIVGLILSNLVPKSHDKFILGSNNFSVTMISKYDNVNVNLVIVPHSLIDQWSDFFSKSKLNVLTLGSKKSFDIFKKTPKINENVMYDENGNPEDNTINESSNVICEKKIKKAFRKYDVFILNANFYSLLHEVFNDTKWARVIIDEIDSIQLKGYFNVQANFTWVLTATPGNICRKNSKTYIGSIFSGYSDLLNYFTVKNIDTFVESSFTLPKPFVYLIETKLNRVFQVFRDLIPADIMQLINAGNMQEAVDKLNCKVDTEENLIEVLSEKTKKELHNLKNDLLHHKNRIPEDVEAHEERTAIMKKRIKECKEKLFDIADRIESIKEECCFICADEFNTPTLMNCCKNVFCLSCLLGSMRLHNRCPYCRTVIKSKDDYCVIGKKDKKEKKIEKINIKFIDIEKKDALENILKFIKKENDKARILIFSNFTQTFMKIHDNIKNAGLTYSELNGTNQSISNIKSKYDDGEINVLLLHGQSMGNGHNLQMTDYLIIFDRMTTEIETQVIGRAQRYGRKGHLKIIYLIVEGENKKTISKDPFIIENIDDMQMITYTPDIQENIEHVTKPKRGSKKSIKI